MRTPQRSTTRSRLSAYGCLAILLLSSAALLAEPSRPVASLAGQPGLGPQLAALDWSASPWLPALPPLDCRSAILIDVETGSLLYAQNIDQVLAPASMVKVLVMDRLLDAVAEGRIDPRADIPIPPAAWARNAPPRSSLMFLGPGQRASFDDLMRGLAVASGNDAAAAAALMLAPSVDAFVANLNQDLADRGWEHTRLADASGYSPLNRTTAREFAYLSREYVLKHPQSLALYHSLTEFAYPRPENFLPGHSEGTIVQRTYNHLLRIMPEADGLKTGTTPSAGYNLTATAQRDGRRLLAVVMGAEDSPGYAGHQKRAELAMRLLEYGFANYRMVSLDLPVLDQPRLYGAAGRSLPVYIDAAWAQGGPIALPTGLDGRLWPRLELAAELWGAVEAGQVLGRLDYLFDGQVVLSAELRASEPVAAAAWPRRLADWLWLQLRRLSGRAFPARLR